MSDAEREQAAMATRLALALSRLRARLREESAVSSPGLSLTQLSILRRLRRDGQMTAVSLAAAEYVSPQAIAQTIVPLKTAGLVRTSPDPTDGRKTLISLTSAGRRLDESRVASRHSWLATAINSSIGRRERSELVRSIELLERLADTAATSHQTNDQGEPMDTTISHIDPRHTVLLVMDYQSAIVGRLPDADELLARMADAIRVARAKDLSIGYVRVAFDDADYAAIPETNERFRALTADRQMHQTAAETQIHAALAPEPGDLVVRKTRVGAFSTTDLDHQLRDRDIDTLILAGISTSGVVLSTVREAADRDYRVYVLEDGIADPDPELHNLLLRKVFPRQATVITAATLKRLLSA